MTNATFFNWTDEAFTGYWGGKGKKFEPGARQLMPDWLAEHFAKHLTNRELLKDGKETATSPKKPSEVPEFMELFNKAYISDGVEKEEDEIDAIIASAAFDEGPSMNITTSEPAPLHDSSPRAAQAAAAAAPAEQVEIITGPADDDDEEEYAVGAQPAVTT